MGSLLFATRLGAIVGVNKLLPPAPVRANNRVRKGGEMPEEDPVKYSQTL
jgi:hypothetical protein